MMIDPHATCAAPIKDKNIIQKSISPFSKGGEGDLKFFLLCHCEERPMQRVNLIESFFPSEEEGFLPDMIRISFIPIPQFNK